MRAVLVREPGDASVLDVAEVPDPVAGPGEVMLDVAATAVNRADVLQRQGRYPAPADAPAWPGLECSGTVSAVGEGVTEWSVGQPACALLAGGGYAEKVVVPAGQLLPIPAGIDLVTAAALPETTCTVWSNVFMLAGLVEGDVLLVHGGSSGIGTTAIQLATAFGARVAVTAGSDVKLARCAELGADILVNYRTQDFVDEVRTATGGHGADVILDNMGAAYLERNVRTLAVNGRLMVIGLQGGTTAELNLGALLGLRGAVHATSLRARPMAEKAEITSQVREFVWPLVEAGAYRPVIDSTFPLAEAGAAHARLESSDHVGKILLVP